MRNYQTPEALVVGEASRVILGEKSKHLESDNITPNVPLFEPED
jgi:hypothetical protein